MQAFPKFLIASPSFHGGRVFKKKIQWEDRMMKDYFKYDVTISEIKVIAGKMNFLSQLNEGQIPDHQSKSELISSASVPDSAILVIIKVTPVEYGHVYLVPCASNKLYPFLDVKSIEISTRLAAEISNQSFRVFYDCYRPNCSVVYFEAFYLPHPLPVELQPVSTFFGGGRRGIQICSIIDYPIKTLSFETTHNFKILAAAISEICFHLEEKKFQYNLMISDSGKRIFLFLQKTCAASRAILAWECGGYFLFADRYEFNQMTEDTMLNQLSCFALDDYDFEAVKQLCCSIAGKFDA